MRHALDGGYEFAVPRRPRRDLDDGFFHVTARAVGGDALFRDDADRSDFVGQLARCTCAFLWVCHAYCLMTTHYHLLVETSRESLSRGMHRLNGVYAQRFNARHERRGHVFEGRFEAYVVDSEEHFAAAIEYVLSNPVRAGLCDSSAEWPWSGRMSEGLSLVSPGTRDWPSDRASRAGMEHFVAWRRHRRRLGTSAG
jgi:putative transposase